MEKNQKSKQSLNKIEDAILNKKHKEPQNTWIRFSTGSDLLDTVVGGGEGLGYPAGRIVNFVGDKSSGKTFLAIEVIVAAKYKYKNKLKWVYDDSESGFSFNTKNIYGVQVMPVDKKDRKKSKTVEDLYCNVREFGESIAPDEVGIYVCDSLDGVGSEEANKTANMQYDIFKGRKSLKDKKGSFKMGKAKYLSDTFFPQLADYIEEKNILLIIISQVRTNIDPMSFEKFTRAGGKALDFYCHTVLWLANIRKLKKKDRSIGVVVKGKTTKSKTPRPYRELYFSLQFDYGLDNITTNVDFLFDFLTPTGQVEAGASAAWNNSSDYTMKQLKEFLIESKKEAYYRKNVNKSLTREGILAWLSEEKNTKLLKKLESKYSAKMKRAELIEYIEANNLQKELTERTLAKWEQIESSIKSNRPPKYPRN